MHGDVKAILGAYVIRSLAMPAKPGKRFVVREEDLRVIKQWMAREEIKAPDLASRLGVSDSTVRRILNGTTPSTPLLPDLLKLAGEVFFDAAELDERTVAENELLGAFRVISEADADQAAKFLAVALAQANKVTMAATLAREPVSDDEVSRELDRARRLLKRKA